MHAFLVIGDRLQVIGNRINTLLAEQKAKQIPFELQKIEDTRNLKKLVKFSFAEKTAIVINDIDKITTEAANAFLKNLEEPTRNIIYILTASNLNNVLPTIVSRSQIVKTPNTKSEILNKSEIQKFLNSKPNQQIEYVGKIKDRAEAIRFVEDLLYIDYEKQDFNNMQNYLDTLKNLKLNGNVSLQLLNLVVRMESQN